MKLSCIIPAYNEQHLQKTIDELLNKSELGNDLEVICVLDGYCPQPLPRPDPRLKIVSFESKTGMRSSINKGVLASTGEYILKTDAHCMFGQGYDRLLMEEIEDNWVVIPRMYKLDPFKWEIMPGRAIDYSKLIILSSHNKLHGEEWASRARHRKSILLDDTMSFQGSCWVMSRKWWDTVVGPLQIEGYGQFIQEPTEIGMKTFRAGGRVMVNKKTWYAHKHRMFNRSHHISHEESVAGNDYSRNLWMEDYLKLKTRFGI